MDFFLISEKKTYGHSFCKLLLQIVPLNSMVMFLRYPYTNPINCKLCLSVILLSENGEAKL